MKINQFRSVGQVNIVYIHTSLIKSALEHLPNLHKSTKYATPVDHFPVTSLNQCIIGEYAFSGSAGHYLSSSISHNPVRIHIKSDFVIWLFLALFKIKNSSESN